jgi:hypothetical protein
MKEKLAMPCTQEQWEQEIKPRIEKIEGVEIKNISTWDSHRFIISNYYSSGIVTNVNEHYQCLGTSIPYDPDRFCASLGEVKWMPLTRGGYEYKIYEEFEGKIFGRIQAPKIWYNCKWELNGENGTEIYDLIPYNPEQEAIKQEIAMKEKELEKLKTKLNK